MKKENILKDLAGDLGEALFKVRNAYIVWRQLQIVRNSMVTSKEFAEETLNILNTHKGFFTPVILSLEHYFNVELFTLITQREGKSVYELVEQAKSVGDDFTDEYATFYLKHNQPIEQIKKCRNQLFAHKDLKVNKKTFMLPSPETYELMFNDLQELFNGITMKTLGQGYWFFKTFDSESYADTNFLIANLFRGENARKTENHVNYRDKLLDHYSKQGLGKE